MSCSAPPGVGKTHLAISLAIAAAQSGRRVYYGTLGDLITSLEQAQQAGRLAQRLKTLVFPALLVVDEIGYLPISRTGATLFCHLMSRRYETASTVLTSNKGFEEWGDLFGDDVMAGALIDRLVHHCHIVNLRGNSYRMKNHAELYAVLTPRATAPPPAHPPGRVWHCQSALLWHFQSALTAITLARRSRSASAWRAIRPRKESRCENGTETLSGEIETHVC